MHPEGGGERWGGWRRGGGGGEDEEGGDDRRHPALFVILTPLILPEGEHKREEPQEGGEGRNGEQGRDPGATTGTVASRSRVGTVAPGPTAGRVPSNPRGTGEGRGGGGLPREGREGGR